MLVNAKILARKWRRIKFILNGERALTRLKAFFSALQHAVFVLPLLILPTYLQPLQAHVLKQFPQLSHEYFIAARLYCVILWSLLRAISIKPLLQTYLENAREKALACSKHAEAFDTVRFDIFLSSYF